MRDNIHRVAITLNALFLVHFAFTAIGLQMAKYLEVHQNTLKTRESRAEEEDSGVKLFHASSTFNLCVTEDQLLVDEL